MMQRGMLRVLMLALTVVGVLSLLNHVLKREKKKIMQNSCHFNSLCTA